MVGDHTPGYHSVKDQTRMFLLFLPLLLFNLGMAHLQARLDEKYMMTKEANSQRQPADGLMLSVVIRVLFKVALANASSGVSSANGRGLHAWFPYRLCDRQSDVATFMRPGGTSVQEDSSVKEDLFRGTCPQRTGVFQFLFKGSESEREACLQSCK